MYCLGRGRLRPFPYRAAPVASTLFGYRCRVPSSLCALLGPKDKRDGRLRRAALIWVVGYSTVAVVEPLGVVFRFWAIYGDLDPRLAVISTASWGLCVVSAFAALRLLRAFGLPVGDAKRSRLLAWAVILEWGGTGIAMLLVTSGFLGLGRCLSIDGLVGAALWMCAAATAAVAFFQCARPDRPALADRLPARERRLLLATSLILVAAVLDSIGDIVNVVSILAPHHALRGAPVLALLLVATDCGFIAACGGCRIGRAGLRAVSASLAPPPPLTLLLPRVPQ